MRWFGLGLILLLAGSVRAQDIPLSEILLPGENWQPVKGVAGTLGALIADRSGNIYVADAGNKRIVKISSAGEISTFAQTSGAVGGLTFSDGTLYATLPGKQQIVRYGSTGKKAERAGLLDRRTERDNKEEVAHDKVPARDLVAHNKRIYYTAPDKKGLLLLGRDEPVATGFTDPAGLAFWPDGGTLVVGDAAGRHLSAFRVRKDGSLDAREPYYPLWTRPKEPSAVRALALDSKRLLYAATKEGVQVFDPAGRLSGILLRPARAAVTALAFGGAERNVLFIVCDGKLWQRKTKVKGVP